MVCLTVISAKYNAIHACFKNITVQHALWTEFNLLNVYAKMVKYLLLILGTFEND